MWKRVLKILLVAAATAVIGCSQSACVSNGDKSSGGDYPYEGPIMDQTGNVVPEPDWGAQ